MKTIQVTLKQVVPAKMTFDPEDVVRGVSRWRSSRPDVVAVVHQEDGSVLLIPKRLGEAQISLVRNDARLRIRVVRAKPCRMGRERCVSERCQTNKKKGKR